MDKAAAKGRLVTSFVPRHWVAAPDSGRVELCKLAEMQLEQYADEDLHRFFVGVVFGGGSTGGSASSMDRSISLVPAFRSYKHGSAAHPAGIFGALFWFGTCIRTHTGAVPGTRNAGCDSVGVVCA